MSRMQAKAAQSLWLLWGMGVGQRGEMARGGEGWGLGRKRGVSRKSRQWEAPSRVRPQVRLRRTGAVLCTALGE